MKPDLPKVELKKTTADAPPVIQSEYSKASPVQDGGYARPAFGKTGQFGLPKSPMKKGKKNAV
jgi:hypothetical protein